MAAPYTVCYVGHDQALRELLPSLWGPDVASWTFFATGRESVGTLLTAPPDLLICAMTLPDMPGLELAELLKAENVYAQVPVVMVLSPEEAEEERSWNACVADDFFVFPDSVQHIKSRLDLALGRGSRALDANPLTRLPGNSSIIQHTQDLITKRRDFALGYCDLDYFKPFNDKYGFARGDEVLMMTSRVICNSVHDLNLPLSFIGHIGGDDFVFIVPVDAAETVCKKIVAAFDAIIPSFYDAEDLVQKCIVSVDRQNKVCTFPLMAISIAVVFNKDGSLKHYGEASNRAMGLKCVAKRSIFSSYALDMRQR